MSCRKFSKRLWEYSEGGLSRSDRERFSKHLKSCAGCRRRLKLARELRSLKLEAGDLPPEGYWTSFWPRLREKIHAEEAVFHRDFYRRVLNFRIKPAYSAAVVAALAVIILAVVLRNFPVPSDFVPSPRKVELPERRRPDDFVLARAGRLSGRSGGGESYDYICSPAGPRADDGPAGDFVISGPHRSPGRSRKSGVRFDRIRTAGPETGGHSYVFALGCLSPVPGGVFW